MGAHYFPCCLTVYVLASAVRQEKQMVGKEERKLYVIVCRKSERI